MTECVCIWLCWAAAAAAAAAGVRSGWQSSTTKKDVQQLNVCIRWSREQSPCVETERSFGFAPPKHRLSPPISLVMSALLIQQGGLGGPGLRWCTGSQPSPARLQRLLCWASSEVCVRTKQKLGLKLKTWANLLELNWESKSPVWENPRSGSSPESSEGSQGNDGEFRRERRQRGTGLLLCLRVS